MNNQTPVLRVARPTDNLSAIKAMYMKGLDLALLGEFFNHEGFDGVILGEINGPYQIEFTSKAGHVAGRAPSPDHLLVFYIGDDRAWQRRLEYMEAAGFRPVNSFNPYWEKHGKTFEDIDGYRVVIQNADVGGGHL